MLVCCRCSTPSRVKFLVAYRYGTPTQSYQRRIRITAANNINGQSPRARQSRNKPRSYNNNIARNERLDLRVLAHRMREEVRSFTTRLFEETQRRIRLAGVLATSRADDGAWAYSRKIQETFLDDGLDYELVECVGERPQDVEAVIHILNQRSDIDGIIVFYPIFPQRTADLAGAPAPTGTRATYLNPSNGVHYTKSTLPYYLNAQTGVYYKTVDDYLRDCVTPSKDVEGLCQKYHRDKVQCQRQLFRTRATPNNVYIPCTAMAVWKIMEYYYHGQADGHDDLNNYVYNFNSDGHDSNVALSSWPKHCNATIINRSTILGRPLAALMASEGFANIFSMDERTVLHYSGDKNCRMRRCAENYTRLEDCLAVSHVVVTAVPDPTFQIPTQALQNNTLVVDATGTNINTEALARQPGRGIRFVTSVGKITIAALQHSLIRLFEQNKSTPCHAQQQD